MGDMMGYLFIALKSGGLPPRVAWDWLSHTSMPEAGMAAVSLLLSITPPPPLRFDVVHRRFGRPQGLAGRQVPQDRAVE